MSVRGTDTGQTWSVANEVVALQRRTAELARELEQQKAVASTLFDATVEQARGVHRLFGILEDHLVKVRLPAVI